MLGFFNPSIIKGVFKINICPNLTKLIKKMSITYSTWQIFNDFLALSAISISNAIDITNKKERENQYLTIVKKYSKNELNIFAEMLGELIITMQTYAEDKSPCDILGVIFAELNLSNHCKGQFFTPHHICEFMGEISITDSHKDIEKKGFITVCEPCTGSGTMILGLASAMSRNKYNYCSQMCVDAIDIDLMCVYMTYIQLSLYGIPARVMHGNSLTAETWSTWYTPIYILDKWAFKLNTYNKISDIFKDVDSKNNNDIEYLEPETAPIPIESDVIINHEQLALF